MGNWKVIRGTMCLLLNIVTALELLLSSNDRVMKRLVATASDYGNMVP